MKQIAELLGTQRYTETIQKTRRVHCIDANEALRLS